MIQRGILLVVLTIYSGLSCELFADTSWNTTTGTWSNSTHWTGGLPDSTDSYIYIRYSSSSVCTLNSDEGLLPGRLVMQNGQTLNIDTGGLVGTKWARVGRESAAYVNLSGSGAFVMNDDDLYVGLEGGSCVWTMSGTSSLYVEPSTAGGDELFIGEDGGHGTLKLVGSDVTVLVDAIHLTANTAGGTATLEYELDASGASTVTADATHIGAAGNAYLVLSASADPGHQDIVLIETTGTGAIGGVGTFTAMNGGAATEGAIVDFGGNSYSLTYQYDASGDGADNDVALIYEGTTQHASEPSPQIGDTTDADETELSWQSPQGVVRHEIYLGTDAAAVANANKLAGDVDGDGLVDLTDLSEMVLQWLMTPSTPCPDLDGSGIVDLPDVAQIGSDWHASASLLYAGATDASTFDPGYLDVGRTYYWRVDSVYCDGIVPSPLWSFNTKLPAFPGAEGFGKWSTGGRGGSVYHVTNLNDSGPGSFRDAISGSNRTVVFDVSGIVNLDSRITTMSKDITIAGQTAPGEGIMIYGDGLSYTNANRSITRYMRYRMGRYGTSDADAVGIANGNNMIFDHCSVSWGRDENFSINNGTGENPGFITIQDCIIAQGLMTHSAGGLITDWDDGVSIIRSLYTDNNTRNPKVRGMNEFINNVVYNWNNAAYIMAWTDSTTAYSYVNAINNYFISGPNMDNTPPFRYGNSAFHIYPSNNWWDSDRDGVLDGRVLVTSDYISNNETVVAEPFDYPGVKTLLGPKAAVKSIGSICGASLPVRDRTDKRLIDELKSYGTAGQFITDEANAPMYGVGTIASGICPTDTDQDGMANYWEESIAGLNATVADNNGDVNGNGYTNLEDYINWLGASHANVQKNAYADIDLRLFTSGFDAGAAYTVSSSTHGTAVIKADGHTARYTPDTDYVGQAELTFTVNDGAAKTCTVELLVSEYGGHALTPVYPTGLVNGLEYTYYEGSWQYLPNFAALTPIGGGYTNNFDIYLESSVDGYGYEFEGFIDVPVDGQYTFWTNSDDGSRLYIDGGVVVSNDGVHGPIEQQGKVSLLAGMHTIRVTYFENSGGQLLEVRWAGPGFEKQLIANGSLYRGSLDEIAPAIPAALTAVAGSGTVSLDWDDNAESDLAGYNVYRTENSGSAYVPLNTGLVTTSGYTDNALSNGVLYHYVISAVDTSTNESDLTTEVSAMPASGGLSAIIQENTLGFCGLDGTVDNNNPGFTGYGFSNTTNATGMGVDWSVNIASAGTYTITLRYANDSSDRPANLLVDGSVGISGISFPNTGDWTTWDQVSGTVTLTAGTHNLRLQATGSGGLANIDYIMISGASPKPADCP